MQIDSKAIFIHQILNQFCIDSRRELSTRESYVTLEKVHSDDELNDISYHEAVGPLMFVSIV